MTPDLPLRDIHLPDPISWWPLAPGWWIAAALGVSLFALIVYILRRWHKQKGIQRAALSELSEIAIDHQKHQDDLRLSQQLSSLLRRTAISIQPRHQAAGLTGEQWLIHLDDLAGQAFFNNDIGQQLINAPYQAQPELNIAILIDTSRQWIRRASQRANQRGRYA